MFYTVKFRSPGSRKWRWTKVFEAKTTREALDMAGRYCREMGYKDYTLVRESDKP